MEAALKEDQINADCGKNQADAEPGFAGGGGGGAVAGEIDGGEHEEENRKRSENQGG